MAENITLTSQVRVNEAIVAAKIDGETVMMSIENGQYYGLDTIGSRIWQLLEGESRVAQICDLLQGEYDVAETQCQTDVMTFLNHLKQKNIINVL